MHTNEMLTTITVAAALGVGLFAVAHAFRLSAIAVLLIGGVLAGPELLGIVNPESLGDGLQVIVSLAVALVLFEGGLTLDIQGYRTAGREIFRVLTIGVLVTWIGSALLLWGLFQFDIPFCFLAASLIIVTGPTVISPLLHRVRVEDRLHHILHWEGVLIDPIGVFISLLCFEFYINTGDGDQLVITDFLTRFFIGAVIGAVSGYLLHIILQRDWVPEGHTNIFVLSMAMLIFGLSDLVISESGLLSVTIAGLVLGSRNNPHLRSIVSYKVELKDLFIGLLFILLAANLHLGAFLESGWKIIALVAGIILLIRPMNIFLSLMGCPLSLNEKLFLSWIAPRGIVAASMASVFTLQLTKAGNENALFLETFTYSVIAGTVLIQGLTAGLAGRFLNVLKPPADGWLIVGANPVGLAVASFLKSQNIVVVVVDTNARDTRVAARAGHAALCEDAMLLDPDAHPELYDCGNLLALTPNLDLNRMLCRRWSEMLEGEVYRWEPSGYETDENRHLLSGTRVWETYPLNRWMLSSDEPVPLHFLDSQELPLVGDQALMSVADGKLTLASSSPASPSFSRSDDAVQLVYRPELGSRHLALPLTPERVLFTDQDDLYELYGEMIGLLKPSHPQLQTPVLLEEMWTHETEYTSMIGHGIALPHVWTSEINQSSLIVCRPRSTVVCPCTHAKIDLVFMLVSPLGTPEEHLRNLASIARLVSVPANRTELMEANSPQALYDVIVSRS